MVNVPKIIFTATPFRNDFKLFDIDENYAYSYSIEEAINKNYLRDLTLTPRPRHKDVITFVDDILNQYRLNFPNPDPSNPPRVIIKCDKRDSILQIAQILSGKRQSVVAIHENFKSPHDYKWQHQHVPPTNETSAVFWIHQFKLLEGIDDERFQMLAIYEDIRNTRSLIQQIGRILRNSSRQKQTAFFLDHSVRHSQSKEWKLYRKYNSLFASKGNLITNSSEALNKYSSALPEIIYTDRRIRERFDLNALTESNLPEELQLPLSVNLIQLLNASFSMTRLNKFLEEKWQEDDFLYKRFALAPDRIVYVLHPFRNSPFLTEKYFYEVSLEVVVIYKMGGLLAYYDSTGFVPLNIDELSIGKSVESSKLKKLLRKTTKSRLVTVSLKNSNIGPRSVRSHQYSAASIEETIPFIDDHAQLLSNIVGYSDELGSAKINEDEDDPGNQPKRERSLHRRYINFSSGKLRQTASSVPLNHYFDWIDNIHSILMGDVKPLSTFNRFSLEIPEVKNTRPKSILIDLAEIHERNFYTIDHSKRIPLEIEDVCQEIILDEDGNLYFTIITNGMPCRVDIDYSASTKKYTLESTALSTKYSNKDKESVIEVLNKFQYFIIIPEDPDTVYGYGRFYRPSVKTGKRFEGKDSQLSNIITGVDILAEIGDEKGKTMKWNGKGWPSKTLFHLIDNLGAKTEMNKFFENIDILVCDDLGTECADFIACSSSKVIFIHAKGIGNNENPAKLNSASALSEVCGQATKNLQYLNLFNSFAPAKIESWLKPYILDKNKNCVVSSRIRNGKGGPARHKWKAGGEVWNDIHTRIKNPIIDKELWIVVGRSLSKNIFMKNLAREDCPHEALQSAMLLQSTLASVGGITAKLRIFCSP